MEVGHRTFPDKKKEKGVIIQDRIQVTHAATAVNTVAMLQQCSVVD